MLFIGQNLGAFTTLLGPFWPRGPFWGPELQALKLNFCRQSGAILAYHWYFESHHLQQTTKPPSLGSLKITGIGNFFLLHFFTLSEAISLYLISETPIPHFPFTCQEPQRSIQGLEAHLGLGPELRLRYSTVTEESRPRLNSLSYFL